MLITKNKHNLVHEQLRQKAVMNVYRRRYDIPDDLMVRKPDKEIRLAMQNSTTIDKVASMAEHSIHPSLLFFERDLDDRSAQMAIAKLHIEDTDGKLKLAATSAHLRETNTLLTAGFP